jgi:hypothetical protein
MLLLPALCMAQSRTESLKRCLADFDGIEWQLPYKPPIDITSCSGPSAALNADKTSDGRRILELIDELTLGFDRSDLSSDEVHGALQSAAFVHFDALFRRAGYQRTALEYGDARTRRDANSVRMLHGLPALSPEAAEADAKLEAAKPAIPYPKLARYSRPSAPGATLTYKTELGNTWSITLEGLPATPAAAGGAR